MIGAIDSQASFQFILSRTPASLGDIDAATLYVPVSNLLIAGSGINILPDEDSTAGTIDDDPDSIPNRLTIVNTRVGITSVAKTGGVTTITLTDGTTHTINDGDDGDDGETPLGIQSISKTGGVTTITLTDSTTYTINDGQDGNDAVFTLPDPIELSDNTHVGEFGKTSVAFVERVGNTIDKQSYLQDDEMSIADLRPGQRAELTLTANQIQFEVGGSHQQGHIRIEANRMKLGGVWRSTWPQPSGEDNLTNEQVFDQIKGWFRGENGITVVRGNNIANDIVIRLDEDDDPDPPDPPTTPTLPDPNIRVLNISWEVNEGQFIFVPVSLTEDPGGSVSVTASESHADLSIAPASLTFNSRNYNRPQNFTFRAAEDADLVNEVNIPVRLTLPDSSSIENGDTIDLSVTIVDNDAQRGEILIRNIRPGNLYSSRINTPFEISISLRYMPTADVTVNITVNLPSSIYTLSTNQLTFNSTNYQIIQSVTFTFDELIPNAMLADFGRGQVTFSASGGNYEGVNFVQAIASLALKTSLPRITISSGFGVDGVDLALQMLSIQFLQFNMPVSIDGRVVSGELTWAANSVSIRARLVQNPRGNDRGGNVATRTRYSAYPAVQGDNIIENVTFDFSSFTPDQNETYHYVVDIYINWRSTTKKYRALTGAFDQRIANYVFPQS